MISSGKSKLSIRNRKPETGNQDGSALIITLLLITILVGLVVDFVYEVYIDSSTLSNWSNAQKASLIAKSGQNISTQYLAVIKGISYTSEREVYLPVRKDFGSDVSLVIKVEDENSKFNINSIIYPNGLTNEKALLSLQKLLEYLNINPAVSLVIADWIDPDNEPRLADSEDAAKNRALWSLDELRLIEGLDRDFFDEIRPYITIFGSNQVNINTAELPVLVSLDPDMTEGLAKQIIEYRETTPFESASSIVNVSGLEAIGIKMLDRITVKCSVFRVTAIATVKGITRIVESIMDTSLRVSFWREG